MAQPPAAGSRTFRAGAEAYDRFMGVYSRTLAPLFADLAEPRTGQRALDVGCGPGALTGELVRRLGADHVAACDPTPGFLTACRERYPGVDLREGRAESLPFDDGAFDLAYSQLVFHFVADPDAAAAELRRVVAPGGRIAICVWADDMALLNQFWQAALAVDPTAHRDVESLRFGNPGEIAGLLTGAGLADVTEHLLEAPREYADFEELWGNFELGVGPAGTYLNGRSPQQQAAVREELYARLGSPTGRFPLPAPARAAVARVP
ncbi:class I SAM-dependent methyltransferase [Granulicoccus phenolivorans]|uniref:class I SAM-dependent methyltransferase n=1 Tax=Granulicoccus phenolivorans TaxID=266854 RepID=UPI0004086E5D|nr:class I SAM-dependent methyltransferase [Granulicoccus phenolivorans]